MKNKLETQRAWNELNREKLKQWRTDNHDQLLEKHRERNKKSPRYAFSSTLAQARKRAEVTIDQAYLMALYDAQEGICALSGLRMTWATGRSEATSISMDRIDAAKGYIDGNVRLICMSVNAFRGTMNDQELLKFATALVNTMMSKQVMKKVLAEVSV